MATVLFFGPLADVLDTGSKTVTLPDDGVLLPALLERLTEKHPTWARYLQADKLQITINRQFVDASSRINNSDEIALIPRPGTI